MGALTIAFDITVVGALALAWVMLVIHLFFSEGEYRLPDLLDWLKDLNQPTAVAVLLFAVTYTLGSAVSRIAGDFFDDDDLHISSGPLQLRVGMTEDRIITSVYCDADNNNLLTSAVANPAIAAKTSTFQSQKCDVTKDQKCVDSNRCDRTLKWREWHKHEQGDDDLIGTGRDLFALQENQILLKGQDPTLRLHQLHDQIMVLRGAAFNVLIAFCLCVFALGAKFRRDRPRSWQRWALMPTPAVCLVVALIAGINHFWERVPSDPPYMEFTVFLLGAAGAWLLWIGPPQPQPKPEPPPAPGVVAEARKGSYWRKERWGAWVVLSGILMIATVLGWWSTEVLYVQQVIYAYNAQAMTQK